MIRWVANCPASASGGMTDADLLGPRTTDLVEAHALVLAMSIIWSNWLDGRSVRTISARWISGKAARSRKVNS